MLRRAAVSAASAHLRSIASNSSWRITAGSASSLLGQRSLVTSAQKRALNKQQLKGGKKEEPVSAPAAAAEKKTGPAPTEGKAPASAPTGESGAAAGSGKGGSGGLLPFLAVATVSAGGAAYYFDLIPLGRDDDKEVEEEAAGTEEELKAAGGSKESVAEEVIAKEAVAEEAEVVVGNRVRAISFPPIDSENRPPQVVLPVSHPEGGSRVDLEQIAEYFRSVESVEEKAAAAVVEAMETPPKEEEKMAAPEPKKVETVVTAERAALELKSSDDEEASGTLRAAHAALRANLDDSLLKDLDALSTSELKVRVVQLAAEMAERTKWEAVRLKEFLAMKEKETAEKYLAILQKQRLEFEDLLARRLREQEDSLTRQANASLQAKEDSIQSVVSANAEALTAEHREALQMAGERLERELSAKYETEYQNKLANEKVEFGKELEGKVAAIEALTEKLRKMESVLEVSRTFESGSQRAHRMSAAALALAEKLETSKGASVELAALKAAAGDDGVIASALSTIPSAVQAGVPTLPELQARFSRVYKVSRQAAFVPEGRTGLEGQLFGMLFSKLTIPPSPDAVSTEAIDDATADHILARAQHFVQVGDLERAVEQLDSLKGQSAFAVKDWKEDAKNRIMLEKSLKVIKLECAILNESMSGGAAA